MKKVLPILFAISFLIFTVDANAAIKERKQWRVRKHNPKHIVQRPPSSTEPVGAPIDGGLLILLAASGIAVYGTKKNKKDKKS